MKDLAYYLLSSIVEDTEALKIEETEGEYGSSRLTINVAKEDMGKVIGKEGRMIRAIRDVIKIKALKDNKHVDVILAE